MTTCDPVAEPRPGGQGRRAVVWAAVSTELGFRIVGGGRPPSTIEEVRGGGHRHLCCGWLTGGAGGGGLLGGGGGGCLSHPILKPNRMLIVYVPMNQIYTHTVQKMDTEKPISQYNIFITGIMSYKRLNQTLSIK
jgi:hypothetical protein